MKKFLKKLENFTFLINLITLNIKKNIMEESIKKLSLEFFNNLGIEIDSLELIKKEENIFLIQIKSDNSSYLIWPHWKNLDAISSILKMILHNQITRDLKIYIEINDYLKSKDEKLRWIIHSKIKIVERNWEDLKLSFYSAYDRKKIHSFVAEYGNENIYTKSIWEGKDRRLFICKKPEALSIDIDWVEI